MNLKQAKHVELHAVTDGSQTVEELSEILLLIQRDVDFIHIREKKKPPEEIVQLIQVLVDGGVPREKLVVNDRVDIALLLGLHNVHLPSAGIPVERLKEKFPELKAGVSVHTLEDALRAEQQGADYVMFGHIFTTRSKPGLSPRGLDALRAVAHTVKRPVVAIGGIHPHNAKDVVEAGAAGIAVMSALFSAENPQKAARSFHFVHKGGGHEARPV